MTRYRYAEVQADRILAVSDAIYLEGDIRVDEDPEWIATHKPEVGDYYVIHHNGTASIYSEYAFHEQFQKIPDEK